MLLLIGNRGTVILQNDFVIGLANDFIPAWRGSSWPSARRCTPVCSARAQPQEAGLIPEAIMVALRVGGLLLALGVVMAVANQDRGIPYVGVIVGVLVVFWSFVLRRLRFGRHVYALGGNAEAAGGRASPTTG